MKRTILFGASVLVGGAVLIAGPLSPPAGPVASSYKTLAEVQPRVAITPTNTPGDANSTYRITSNGSYYLTGDVITPPGKSGIEIAADDVTIDLNGFRVGGYPGALEGIIADGQRRNICVFGGSVWTMGGDGINLAYCTGARVREVSVRDCGGDGLRAPSDSIVDRVTCSGNAGAGIYVGYHCTVMGCTADNNGSAGIYAGEGCSVTSCAAADNAQTGISVAGGSVRGCASYNNAGKGIWGGYGIVIAECTSSRNAEGGIYGGIGGLIEGCNSYKNDTWGISTVPGCTVTGCTVRENGEDGIIAYSGCTIRNNTCVTNGTSAAGGAGILATNGSNRIEGNTCLSSDRGIQTTSSGNVIIRNTCGGNGVNWQISTGNALAPIVAASTNQLVVAGSSYAGSLGSTDPNANFSH